MARTKKIVKCGKRTNANEGIYDILCVNNIPRKFTYNRRIRNAHTATHEWEEIIIIRKRNNNNEEMNTNDKAESRLLNSKLTCFSQISRLMWVQNVLIKLDVASYRYAVMQFISLFLFFFVHFKPHFLAELLWLFPMLQFIGYSVIFFFSFVRASAYKSRHKHNTMHATEECIRREKEKEKFNEEKTNVRA